MYVCAGTVVFFNISAIDVPYITHNAHLNLECGEISSKGCAGIPDSLSHHNNKSSYCGLGHHLLLFLVAHLVLLQKTSKWQARRATTILNQWKMFGMVDWELARTKSFDQPSLPFQFSLLYVGFHPIG